MLVAPVRRWAIVIGKCLGGATVASFQGIIFLALAGVAHVPYGPVCCWPWSVSCAAVVHADRVRADEGRADQADPGLHGAGPDVRAAALFLSGALYPLNGLPAWLTVLTRIDPLTYIVCPMQQAVFSHLPVSSRAAAQALVPVSHGSTGLSHWDYLVAMVAIMVATMLAIAIAEFRKTE